MALNSPGPEAMDRNVKKLDAPRSTMAHPAIAGALRILRRLPRATVAITVFSVGIFHFIGQHF